MWTLQVVRQVHPDKTLNICILVSGHGTTMEAIAEAIEKGMLSARISLVISDRPSAEALDKAAKRGIPTLVIQPPPKGPVDWEDRMAGILKTSGCELIVLAGYLRILKGPVLDAYHGRIINIHPALLPKFGGSGMYGTKVHAAVLSSGDKVTGSTVHVVTREVDRGPVIAQKTMDVKSGETPEQLSDRQRPLEHELMVDVIRRFAKGELQLPFQKEPLTYSSLGVNSVEIRAAVNALVGSIKYKAPSAHGVPFGAIGHYAGIITVGDMMLAMTTDGVGTKVLIAEALGRWEEVGEDMVGVNVNDLLAAGSTPVALVDYVICRHPDASVLAALGRGLNRGLEKAQCSLLGGETSVVPEMMYSGFDLSATAVGFFAEDRKPVIGGDLRPGDVLIGLPSNGFHSNGYTLIRRLLRDKRIGLDEKVPGEKLPLGEALLKPTRIYFSAIEPLLKERLPIALAHNTGGGFRNLYRLNHDVEFILDQLPRPQGLFAWIANVSGLPAGELYQTFNMGIGFVIGVRPEEEKKAMKVLTKSGETEARVIGHIGKGKGVTLPREGVHYPDY
jgi:phosphoribosylformylglycinamidine cyclo-ligase